MKFLLFAGCLALSACSATPITVINCDNGFHVEARHAQLLKEGIVAWVNESGRNYYTIPPNVSCTVSYLN